MGRLCDFKGLTEKILTVERNSKIWSWKQKTVCTGIFSKKKRNYSMRLSRAVSFNFTKWIVNTFNGVISDGYFPLNQTLLVSCVVYMCRPEFSVPM